MFVLAALTRITFPAYTGKINTNKSARPRKRKFLMTKREVSLKQEPAQGRHRCLLLLCLPFISIPNLCKLWKPSCSHTCSINACIHPASLLKRNQRTDVDCIVLSTRVVFRPFKIYTLFRFLKKMLNPSRTSSRKRIPGTKPRLTASETDCSSSFGEKLRALTFCLISKTIKSGAMDQVSGVFRSSGAAQQ